MSYSSFDTYIHMYILIYTCGIAPMSYTRGHRLYLGAVYDQRELGSPPVLLLLQARVLVVARLLPLAGGGGSGL